jgi:ADP-heptose:LPS heptosyltransferase
MRGLFLASKKVESIVKPIAVNSNSLLLNTLVKNPKAKICIIRSLGGIGDVLMTTPAIRELKSMFPNCHLTYAVDMSSTINNNYYELVKNAPFIDEVIDCRRLKTYDAVKDISTVCIRHENSGLPSLNRIDIFGKALGFNSLANPLPFYKVTEEEDAWATNKLKEVKVKKVVLHISSNEDKRCWPEKKYKELVESLEGYPIKFIVFDFNNRSKYWSTRDNCMDFSLTNIREMAALISKADLLVGPDSGPMHIAGALSVPSVVFFGSIPPQTRINYYPSHEAMQAQGIDCLGCWYKPCPFNFKCMKNLHVTDVKVKILKKLNIEIKADGEKNERL